MSFKKTFFKNTFQLATYNYLSEGVNFISSMAMARLLLPSEFGFVAMIYVLSNFATVFADAGFGSDIIRKDFGYTYHKSMVNLSFYIGTILVLIMMGMAYPLALFYDNKKLIVPTILISLQFFYKSLSITYYSLLLKKMEFSYLGKVNLFGTMLCVCLMISMAALGFSYWSLIIPVIIVDFLKFVAYRIKSKLKFKLFPLKYAIVAFKESKSIILSMLGVKSIMYWANNADNMLIGKIYGDYKLGIYNRAYRFINLTQNLISKAFGSVMYPSLKKHQDENGDIYKEYLAVLDILAIISYPIGFILIVIPKYFVLVLWGERWLEVANLLPYFGLYILVLPMKNTFSVMYRLLHKEKLMFYLGLVSATLTVSAIVTGLQFSIETIAQLISLTHVAIILPIEIIWGFIKGFKFEIKKMMAFWGIKIIFYLALFITIYKEFNYTKIGIIILYILYLLLGQRKGIKQIINKVLKKNVKS